MPRRYVVKDYQPNQFYHVYNRALANLKIFRDDRDYQVFINFLKAYLSPQDPLYQPFRKTHDDLSDYVQLIGFCLLPDHYHLLLYQRDADGIAKLMKRLATGYGMYFNRRWQRHGHLFDGIYRAAPIPEAEQLTYLSRWLHLNPAGPGQNPIEYAYSSYSLYLRGHQPPWINPQPVLNLFKTLGDYRRFVTDTDVDRPDSLAAVMMDDCKPAAPPPVVDNATPNLGLQF